MTYIYKKYNLLTNQTNKLNSKKKIRLINFTKQPQKNKKQKITTKRPCMFSWPFNLL